MVSFVATEIAGVFIKINKQLKIKKITDFVKIILLRNFRKKHQS